MSASADGSVARDPQPRLLDRGDRIRALVEALQSPACVDHGVDRFQLLETHISYVLLTGRYAYKIKKPVSLPFLDFSTLENRKLYLEEELRLNRRTAPELYLDIVAITGDEASPVINGSGPILEYALKMGQFAQDARLDRVASRGELRLDHIRCLARDVAEFHRCIPVADRQTPFASSERLHDEVMGNFQTVQSFAEAASLPVILEPLAELKRWSARSLAGNNAHFRRRKRDGFVRECHGDMHLANIALLNDRAVPFDCIEFNENLRWIDVMSDVAFLLMDLDYRGHPGLARLFLNTYLEQTGDYSGLALLRHYLTYRAMVRATVSSIRLGQAVRDRNHELEQLLAHLILAERYTGVPRPRALVITHGLSGSGKSWLAEQLVMSTDAIRIRSDVERKRIIKGDLYSPAATARTYTRLAELARAVLDAGYSAVVDATFLRRSQRHQFMELADERSVPFLIVKTQAPENLLAQRLAERAIRRDDPSDATLPVLDKQRRSIQPLTEREAEMTITVDTSRVLDLGEVLVRMECESQLPSAVPGRQKEVGLACPLGNE